MVSERDLPRELDEMKSQIAAHEEAVNIVLARIIAVLDANGFDVHSILQPPSYVPDHGLPPAGIESPLNRIEIASLSLDKLSQEFVRIQNLVNQLRPPKQ